jgi:hypothetical protein
MIPGGDPMNPLGKYRMRLTLDLYGIHGTNIPWGVGMLVSHGCVRLYPEDIEKFYPMIPVGTPGVFVYQPIKVGMKDGRVFVEVHKDMYGMKPGMYRETRAKLEQHGFMSLVDESKLNDAVLAQSGIPVDVTIGGGGSRGNRLQAQRPDAAPRAEQVGGARAPSAVVADDLQTDNLRPVSGHLEGRVVPQAQQPAARRPDPAAAGEALMPAEMVTPPPGRGREPGLTDEVVR